MLETPQIPCPDCDESSPAADNLDRRNFIRVVGGSAAALALSGAAAPGVLAQNAIPRFGPRRGPKPAEALVQELFLSMTEDQKRMAVYPWNHGQTQTQLPIRLRFFNRAYGRTVSEVYTNPQRELIQRSLRAICADDAGFERFATVVRQDNWNNSSFNGAGVNFFGNPTQGQFAWVFTAHHLTLRCDGDSEPNAAFGGPMYYGHAADGYSQRNVFYFQTQSVRRLFDALSPAQRTRAVLTPSANTPGENYESVRFRPQGQAVPGLPMADLSWDQRLLVMTVMADILAPFRREDVTEVMDIVGRNDALDRMHFAFYRNPGSNADRWQFWRLEGPGFVWNYRVLPHVHCFVNIAVRA